MARPLIQRDPRTGVFAVSSHALVQAVLRDPETFSSRTGPVLADSDALPLRELLKQTVPLVDTLADADPPEHTRFRGLVSGEFAPARVASLGPELEKRCHALVDDFAARGRCELRAEYAEPLALSALADRLGVPRADLPLLQRWTSGFGAQRAGLAPDEDPLDAMRRILEFQHYFAVRIDEARHAPRDDLLSHLCRAGLEIGESLSVVQQLLIAGVDTTASAIVAGVRHWIERPEVAALLRPEPVLVPGFAEEVLRLAAPMKIVKRRAARPAELGGVAIPAQALVLLEIGAANRDPSVFPDPDRLDPRRANAAEHLAFGDGIHACLGAQLARAQLDAAFRVLLERLDDLRAHGAEITFSVRR
jgi:cytochrome P450